MKCTKCGQECYYTQEPEIVFADDENIICEECGINFIETENGIVEIDH
jgi:predicted nucleic acid-binding Zn ribbon protein